jgi:hypothetical protein
MLTLDSCAGLVSRIRIKIIYRDLLLLYDGLLSVSIFVFAYGLSLKSNGAFLSIIELRAGLKACLPVLLQYLPCSTQLHVSGISSPTPKLPSWCHFLYYHMERHVVQTHSPRRWLA